MRYEAEETEVKDLSAGVKREHGDDGNADPCHLNSKKPKQAQPLAHYDDRYAITFGETAILHVGGKELGGGKRDEGFTVPELEAIAAQIDAAGGVTELYRQTDRLPLELQTAENQAATLVIRGGASFIAAMGEAGTPEEERGESAADALYREQQEKASYDRRFFDSRTKKTKNKQARYNTVFGPDDRPPNEDYSEYTICGFPRLPHLDRFRRRLPALLGPRAEGLNAEGNLYFHGKAGIGYHGDAERKVVVCLSLGRESLLRYHWRLPGSSEHTLAPIDIRVGHGDVYIMSEKATGHDWRFRSRVRLVHAAGHSKYTGD